MRMISGPQIPHFSQLTPRFLAMDAPQQAALKHVLKSTLELTKVDVKTILGVNLHWNKVVRPVWVYDVLWFQPDEGDKMTLKLDVLLSDQIRHQHAICRIQHCTIPVFFQYLFFKMTLQLDQTWGPRWSLDGPSSQHPETTGAKCHPVPFWLGWANWLTSHRLRVKQSTWFCFRWFLYVPLRINDHFGMIFYFSRCLKQI